MNFGKYGFDGGDCLRENVTVSKCKDMGCCDGCKKRACDCKTQDQSSLWWGFYCEKCCQTTNPETTATTKKPNTTKKPTTTENTNSSENITVTEITTKNTTATENTTVTKNTSEIENATATKKPIATSTAKLNMNTVATTNTKVTTTKAGASSMASLGISLFIKIVIISRFS